MENSMEVPQKIYIITIWSSNSTYGTQTIESRVSKRYVHSSTVHNRQKIEATQASINRWMDKQNVMYTHNGILFSLEEGSTDTWYDMDEPWGYYAQWNKPVTKRQMEKNSTYMRSLEQSDS